ncbi:M18 family aminopeptidase [Propionibacterium sp. NM47_B9-13]|jgi:aspartyl aminopeptidase|uniref:M18 family aminopeptidase n=2 Tax=Cutibacterium modestum TaxID=2559073 RepID=A0AAD1KQR0_9ACTN|nr:M18 family aminopeptidase [Cutibacterium modestum]TGY27213.1 M18 family aminopeptidase [Propionibacterium sp. NM47_B9-13]AOH46449.1 M18 family aminopeptidase [Cutibacterium modestum]EFS74733.1 aminopeptidase I zinc metalloprotease (M18) [Cutibacterium modestum HL037PA2]EFS93224.1 aminopeptidase I zinc metalloprotease (M18) [Cutibacterium modestum HL044PA1]EGG27658.1 putative aminopeptidase 2 [Cutibacterium modestum P08]
MVDMADNSVPASDHTRDIISFVEASPTSYHAAAELAQRLERTGFHRLDETEAWSSVEGRHYVVRDGAVIAWITPAKVTPRLGVRIVGSHTDSPSFKLKPNATVTNQGWQQVGMEVYGGGLLNSWLDRDLGLSGRLVTRDGQAHLVRTGPILRISQLAPHLDRTVNDDLKLDRQRHLMPILSVGRPDLDVEDLLCEAAEIKREELAFHDVFAYLTQSPAIIGPYGEFLASQRMDNLSSVHSSVAAFVDVKPTEDIAVMACFDHEEVGSATRSGACGPFLEDILVRIAEGMGITGASYRAMIARSSCVSSDAGHGVHPNYVEKFDPANHPLLNEGSLLKINANQRYATDGVGGALWQRACTAAGVPTQDFVSNNSVPCGSTIGPLTATRLGMLTVDVGVPLMSMHSTRELAGTADLAYLSKALGAYWAGA